MLSIASLGIPQSLSLSLSFLTATPFLQTFFNLLASDRGYEYGTLPGMGPGCLSDMYLIRACIFPMCLGGCCTPGAWRCCPVSGVDELGGNVQPGATEAEVVQLFVCKVCCTLGAPGSAPFLS